MLDLFAESFLLGLLTPLTAVCVLPIYPAFLSYLSNSVSGNASSRKWLALFGVTITVGVILFMLLLGLIFTTFLQVSLTDVVGIASPIAFVIMGVLGVLLIFDLDFGKFLPKFRSPTSRNPFINSFLYGFFFGAIVVPCNPTFIAILFARTFSFADFTINVLRFIFFGIGIGFPLLIFSIFSLKWSQKIINFLTKYKSLINRVAGILLLIISIYYLIFVFKIFML